jgi:hypothetical protein
VADGRPCTGRSLCRRGHSTAVRWDGANWPPGDGHRRYSGAQVSVAEIGRVVDRRADGSEHPGSALAARACGLYWSALTGGRDLSMRIRRRNCCSPQRWSLWGRMLEPTCLTVVLCRHGETVWLRGSAQSRIVLGAAPHSAARCVTNRDRELQFGAGGGIDTRPDPSWLSNHHRLCIRNGRSP